MTGIPQSAGSTGPGEAIAGLIDAQPFETLMLVAQSDFRTFADKRGEDDRHLYGLSGVRVEAVHRDVVERLDLQSRLFAQLPDCRALRAFSCVDLAVNELP